MDPLRVCTGVVLPQSSPEKLKEVRRFLGEQIKVACSGSNLKTLEVTGPAIGFLEQQPASVAHAYTCYTLPPAAQHLPGRTLAPQLHALAHNALDRATKQYPGVLMVVTVGHVAHMESAHRCFLGCSDRRQVLDLSRDQWDKGQPNQHWGERLVMSALARREDALLGEDFPQTRQALLDALLPAVETTQLSRKPPRL